MVTRNGYISPADPRTLLLVELRARGYTVVTRVCAGMRANSYVSAGVRVQLRVCERASIFLAQSIYLRVCTCPMQIVVVDGAGVGGGARVCECGR